MTNVLERTTGDCGCGHAARGDGTGKGCENASTPCAPSGSCAFDGAKVVLQPITDAVHLVHGPLACEGNSWDYRPSSSSGSRIHRAGFTTDLNEITLVMGQSEKRLYKSLHEIVLRHAPSAIFVYATCVTALIGDDIAAVCKLASEALGTPCIPVPAPGFIGARTLGNRVASEVLFEHVIGTVEPEHVSDLDLNLIGEYNLCGELWEVLPLFEELGIRVHAAITGDARYRAVASCHRVRANLVVCSVASIQLAEKMHARYGIPYFEGSFYGIANTSQALRGAARVLVERGAAPQLLERTETLIAREEARAWQRIAPHRARLEGKRALLHTGGYKAWSMIAALHEAGMEVAGTTTRKTTSNDKARAAALLHTDEQAFEALPPQGLRARLAEVRADLLISGERWEYIAQAARIPWLEVNHGRHLGFAGYEGSVRFVEQLDLALNSPVWSAAHAPAPWDEPQPRATL